MPGIAACIPLSLLLSFYLSRQAGVLAAQIFSRVEVLTTLKPLSQLVINFIMRWLIFPVAVLLLAGSAALLQFLELIPRI
jgi:hypothetical protein